MKAAISLLVLVASVLAQSQEFEEFRHTYNKIYKDANELQTRQRNFEQNKKIIDEHNERFARRLETFEMGVNKFTDLPSSEFQSLGMRKYKQSNVDRKNDHLNYDSSASVNFPKSIDWFKKGAVTDVKDDNDCNSGWAFAAVATLEGQYFLKTKELVELSAQNLLDCSSNEKYGNEGCIQGWPYWALEYVLDNQGIQLEEKYVYEGYEGPCRYREEYREEGIEITKIKQVEPGNERLLAATVAAKGPIAVSFDASHLRPYKRGVYNIPCKGSKTTHDATIVGYGHDTNGGDYWLVKNSWGSGWGEDGYFRIARNKGNMCGIANNATYPIIE